jgi:hypothetical protein
MTPFKVLSLSLVVIVGFTCALFAAPEIFDGHHPALGWPIFAVFVLSCVTYLYALAKVDHGRGKTWIVLCALSFIVVPIGPIGGYLLTCTAVVGRRKKDNRPTQEGAAGIKAFIGAWLCWLSFCILGSATHEMLNPTLAEILYKGITGSGAALFLGTIYVVARSFINLFRRKKAPMKPIDG